MTDADTTLFRVVDVVDVPVPNDPDRRDSEFPQAEACRLAHEAYRGDDHDTLAHMGHLTQIVLTENASKGHGACPACDRKFKTPDPDRQLLELLNGLVGHEDSPCLLDHHGYCQEHPGGFNDEGCITKQARAILAEKGML